MRKRLAALAILALTGAGCSDTPAETGTTTTTEKPTFSQCMRDNGVKEFPDPDASGELTIDGVLNGSSLNPESAAWKKAIRACKDLQPSGFTGRKRTPEQQDDSLTFAQCIRDAGVKDFPDPLPDGPLVDTNRIPSASTDAGMRVLNAAMKTCGRLAEIK
jgi:hypothetical protein